MEWNSPKTGFFDDSIKRTLALANAMENTTIISSNTGLDACGDGTIHSQSFGSYGIVSNDIGNIIKYAVITLNTFPQMLKYKFGDDKNLEKIEVHSHVVLLKQLYGKEKENICENACKVHAAIQLFIDNVYTQGITRITQKPYVTLTSKLSDKCHYGAMNGGSKSKHRRRRHSRRKLRAKTHKRRRH